MTRRFVSPVVQMPVLLAACLMLAGPLSAADPVSADRRVPPDVKLFVTIPNISDVKSRWKETLFGRLENDRELADFRKAVEEQLEQASAELEKQTGVKLSDLLDVPGGEITLAMWQTAGAKPSFAALLDFGQSRETVDKLLSKAADALEKQEARKKTDKFQDVSIITYTLPADETDNDAGGRSVPAVSFSYFLKDSHLVVGSNAAALKEILSRWDGKHPRTFADNKAYRYIIERCKSEATSPVTNWYVDPVGLVHGVISASGNQDLTTQLILGFLPAMGITKLRAIGGSVDIATGEYDTISRTVFYVDSPPSGLLNALKFPAIKQGPPEWVPASTSTYYGANWNVAGAYAAVENLYDSFSGPGAFAARVDKLAEDQNGPMLHVKRDLIDHLTGRIHLLSGMAKTGNDDAAPAAERTLIALGAKDSAKVKSVLAKIAEMPGFPGKARQFQGETIYELSTAGLGVGPQTTMGIGVTRGHLMIASDVTLLEAIIRGDKNQKPLAGTLNYRRIAAKFPAKTAILGFQNQNSQLKALYDLLRSGQAGQLIRGVDLQKLPPFETINKYLRATGSYFVPDEHGVLYVSFTLRDEDK